MTDSSENAAPRTPWMQLAWTGAMWIATAWCASFYDDRWVRVWAFAVSSLLVVLTLGWLYATQRLADIQRQLIAAYEAEAEVAEEMIASLKQELGIHRRAFRYAAAIRMGKTPLQAGLIAARDVEMPPTEDIT